MRVSLLVVALSSLLLTGLVVAAPSRDSLAVGSTCVVADPNSAPLPVRRSPRGTKVGELTNGTKIQIQGVTDDDRGLPWVKDRRGWVFGNYLNCPDVAGKPTGDEPIGNISIESLRRREAEQQQAKPPSRTPLESSQCFRFLRAPAVRDYCTIGLGGIAFECTHRVTGDEYDNNDQRLSPVALQVYLVSNCLKSNIGGYYSDLNEEGDDASSWHRVITGSVSEVKRSVDFEYNQERRHCFMHIENTGRKFFAHLNCTQ